MDNEQPIEAKQQKQSHFPWAILFLSTVVIVVTSFAYHAYIKTGQTIKQVGTEFVRTISAIAEKFKTGTITHTFIEQIPDISSTNGDILELSTSRSEEIFTRSDSKSILWDAVDLGTTVSEIRVPVKFRYHIRLSGNWRLATKNHVCKVLAPPILPSLPPAIYTNQMEKSTTSGWARFNKDDILSELERSITPELEKRAGDTKHLKLVREACRQSVADFVKKWLMKEDYWRDDRFSSILVVFPDEVKLSTDQELEQYSYGPTVKLN